MHLRIACQKGVSEAYLSIVIFITMNILKCLGHLSQFHEEKKKLSKVCI